MIKKRLLLITLFLFFYTLSALDLQAQGMRSGFYKDHEVHRNPVLVFLNKFSFTLTSGFGSTRYKHTIGKGYYIQTEDMQIISSSYSSNSSTVEGYTDWASNPVYVQRTLKNEDLIIQVEGDKKIEFEGSSFSSPLTIGVHFDIKKFRLGFGYLFETHRVNKIKSSQSNDNRVRDYVSSNPSFNFTRTFFTIGYNVFSLWNYNFVTELQIGSMKARQPMNNEFINTSGLYTSIGLSVEHILSEYLRVIIKPSYDFKKYMINLPNNDIKIEHKNPSFYVSVGLNFNVPEIPRSPIKKDRAQVKHVVKHPRTGKRIEVRGQPVDRYQNPKIGQNHRSPWRFMKKNRKKLTPY